MVIVPGPASPFPNPNLTVSHTRFRRLFADRFSLHRPPTSTGGHPRRSSGFASLANLIQYGAVLGGDSLLRYSLYAGALRLAVTKSHVHHGKPKPPQRYPAPPTFARTSRQLDDGAGRLCRRVSNLGINLSRDSRRGRIVSAA